MKKAGIVAMMAIIVVSVFAASAATNSSLFAAAGNSQAAKPSASDSIPVDGFSSPLRIAFGPGATLLVTDYDLKMVAFVDPLTNLVKGGFSVDGRPLGVAYGRRTIFVGNQTKACISVYDETGVWREDISGGALAPIAMPTDLAFDPATNLLYVLDFSVRAIKIFQFNGKERGTIPASYPDRTALTTPTAIALDPLRAELVVSDYGGTDADGSTIRPRLQIFSLAGGLVSSISSYAPGGMMGGTYRFSRPQGLQVDSLGQVIFADSYSGEVLIISRSTGAVVKTLGGYGTDPGKMRLPLDLVMDEASKDIFVTNNLLKRIEIFRQGGIY